MKNESHLVVVKYSYIYFLIIMKKKTDKKKLNFFFSLILAAIVCACKMRFLGNMAVRFLCRMCSTLANCRTVHALSKSV